MSSFRKKGRVSAWRGAVRVDSGIDVLRGLRGVGDYDHDDQEVVGDDIRWRPQSVGALLSQVSYSDSFREKAIGAATQAGIAEALYVICQFDLAYDPKKVSGDVASEPRFLGHFAWSDQDDPCM